MRRVAQAQDEAEVTGAAAARAAAGDDSAADTSVTDGVHVTIGTSALMSDGFVRAIYSMVNGAYGYQRCPAKEQSCHA